MKNGITLAALVLSLLASPAVRADEGGRCHFHGSKPATVEVVTACAVQRKAQLVSQGKLEASWNTAKANAPEQVDGKKGKEWKLSFQNPGAADKGKQTLYLFYTLPGNFIAANFTGQ